MKHTRYESITPQTISLENYTFVGVSVAGVGTSITIPSLKVCFDTAQGLPHAYHMKHYLVTHAHMDHAGGIPYILSQKGLTGQDPGTFYMPLYMLEPMKKIMNTWASIEDYKCPYNFIGTEYEKSYAINNEYIFKIFKTHHRVESNGYTVFKKNKKLKPQYKDLTQDEIINLKKQNIEISEYLETPEVSFTGDTKIEFLDTCPWIKKSKIIIMEVTYAGSKKTVENSRKWGHIHLDELIPYLDSIEAKKILLIHQSSRYSIQHFKEEVDKIIPPEHRNKIEIFPR